MKPSHHGWIGKKNNVIIERDLLRRLFTLLIQQIHDTKLANIVPQESCNLAASLDKAGLERCRPRQEKKRDICNRLMILESEHGLHLLQINDWFGAICSDCSTERLKKCKTGDPFRAKPKAVTLLLTRCTEHTVPCSFESANHPS